MKKENLIILILVTGTFAVLGSDIWQEHKKKEMLSEILDLPEQSTCSSEVYGDNGEVVTITWLADKEGNEISCDPKKAIPLIEKYLRFFDLDVGVYRFQSTKEAKLYFDIGDI